MKQFTIHEAKTHLSRLIRQAIAGEEIIIAKGTQPLVKLVVLPQGREKRRIGGARDAIEFMAEDFDEPLDEFDEYS